MIVSLKCFFFFFHRSNTGKTQSRFISAQSKSSAPTRPELSHCLSKDSTREFFCLFYNFRVFEIVFCVNSFCCLWQANNSTVSWSPSVLWLTPSQSMN